MTDKDGKKAGAGVRLTNREVLEKLGAAVGSDLVAWCMDGSDGLFSQTKTKYKSCDEYLDGGSDCKGECIEGIWTLELAFSWCRSVDGHAYWSDISAQLRKLNNRDRAGLDAFMKELKLKSRERALRSV